MIFLSRLVEYVHFLEGTHCDCHQWRSSKLMILYDPDASQQSVIIPQPHTMDSDWWRFHSNIPAPSALPATSAHGPNTGVPRKKCIVGASSDGRFASCVVHLLLVFQDSVRSLAVFSEIWFFRCDHCRMRFRGSWLCRLFLPNLRLKVLNYSIINIQLTYVES